jgi:hypothetical protein
MKRLIAGVLLTFLIFILMPGCFRMKGDLPASRDQVKSDQIPRLEKKGAATQLIVEGSPFIIPGGELGNSSFTSTEYMEPVWPKPEKMNLNTVLAPVYWELIEPEGGVVRL